MVRVRTITRGFAIAMLAAALMPTSAWALTTPLTTPLTALDFSSATQGYIVGYDNSSTGVVSWTNDGGASWHAKIQPNRLMVGVCASVDGGTALPGYHDGIYKSSDSGITWTAEAPVLGRIAAYSDMTYLAGGRRVVVGKLASNNNIALITSSVGGAAWNIDFQGPLYTTPEGTPDPSLTRATLTAIDAVSGGNTAWAVGSDWSTTGPSGPYEALIYKTINGGSTWTTQTAGAAAQIVNCVSAVDAQHAFIGRASRTLLRTLDGSTWAGIDIGFTSNITSVNGIDALDANHVLVVGNTINNAGRIAWTSNGSATTPAWTVSAVAPGMLLGAQMLDATHWIVVGDNETILRTADGGATWTGQTAATNPTVAITSPASEHLLDSATISIAGTSRDGLGIGVANVKLRLQRQDGKYWNGLAWVVSESWIDAAIGSSADGWDTWEATVTLPSTAVGSLTVWAKAFDGLGRGSTALASVSSAGGGPTTTVHLSTGSNSSLAYGSVFKIGGTLRGSGAGMSGQHVVLQSAAPGGPWSDVPISMTTGSGGAFLFSVNPVTKKSYRVRFAAANGYPSATSDNTVYATPKTYVRTPIAPYRMSHSRYYKIYGYLKPRHTAGTYPVRIYKWRYVSGRWKSYGYTKAKAYNYSSYTKYAQSIRLRYTGRWRVRAYAPADSRHAATWSSGYDYIKVR